jgi:type I restriction-modification system DNA methylase subunit
MVFCEISGARKIPSASSAANSSRLITATIQASSTSKKRKDARGLPDELTITLNIDDKVLKDILRNLYYPDSPYEFSVLPAEILGQVYEQFLGKVIRLTAGGQAKVEDKPEVKKAGGVYYTPTYIVDYIVEQTLGKLLAGLTPRDAAKLKICDPACGSGSFLLGAYQYLLDWHRDFYAADDPEKYTALPAGVSRPFIRGRAVSCA